MYIRDDFHPSGNGAAMYCFDVLTVKQVSTI